MSTETTAAVAGKRQEHKVDVTVNNQAVIVEAPENTGFGVKESAIAQGVKIEADFQLAEVKGKKRKIIGDDVIHLVGGEVFVATTPDDNS